MTRQSTGLAGWTPVHVSWEAGRPTVEWRDLRGFRFVDPFFETTVDRALWEPYRMLFAAYTPIDVLGDVAAAEAGVPPTGFIFHSSRCGSTLISNMLGGLDETIVVSEPPVLDGVLRADLMGGYDDENRRRWLGWAMTCLGQRRGGGERRLFVKFDAWCTRDIALVRSVYPDVPCVFVYRNPAEIIAHQIRMRGVHMVPGMLPAELFGLEPGVVGTLDHEDYCARVVASILDAAGQQGGCRLVNYRDLPELVIDDLLGHFGVRPSADEAVRLRAIGRVDAKHPGVPFDDHTGPERLPIRPSIVARADRWAAGPYDRLEGLRAAGVARRAG
jgi:hypothetical protein